MKMYKSTRVKVIKSLKFYNYLKLLFLAVLFNYLTDYIFLELSLLFLSIPLIKNFKRKEKVILIIPPIHLKLNEAISELIECRRKDILNKYDKIIFYDLKELIPYRSNQNYENYEYPIKNLGLEDSNDIFHHYVAKMIRIYLLNYQNSDISIYGICDGANIAFFLSKLLNYKVENLILYESYIPLSKNIYKEIINNIEKNKIKLKINTGFNRSDLKKEIINLIN